MKIKSMNENKTLDEYLSKSPLLYNHIKKNKINLIKNRSEPDFRAYKDESTNNFVNTFFHDENTLNLFVYYNFQTIHYNIISNINSELIKNNEIIKNDEDIYIIFKGGNIMHFYFKKIVEFITKNKNNNDNEYLKDLNDLNKYFKISDVDLSIYILNNDERKYNTIYFYITKLLVKSLEQIQQHFENIYKNNVEYIKELQLPLLDEKLFVYFIDDKNNENNIDLYKIHSIYKECYNNIINKNNDRLQFILNIFKNKENKNFIFTDCYIGSRYIMLLEMIKYFSREPGYTLQNLDVIKMIDNIIILQKQVIEIELNNTLFKLKYFYSNENIKKMIEGIVEKFNSSDFQNKDYYNHIENPSIKYNINKKVETSNIIIAPRQNFILRASNSIDYNKLIIFNNSFTHYISINNIISNYIGSKHIVSFDLYRIKFNIILQNVLDKNINIPSEFLDISIPKFFDFNLVQLRSKIYNNFNYINYFSKLDNNRTKCFNILSTNLKYTIKDLNIVLFEQNTFIPWNDLKYNKRIIRLLFMTFVLYFQKANHYDCLDLFNNQIDIFIKNIDDLRENILKYFTSELNERDVHKNNIIESMDKLIYNNENKNLLKLDTLTNFYDYSNINFFKIKYYNKESKILENVIHEELDFSINIILKIIFFIIEGKDIYDNLLLEKLDEYNYIFDSIEQKKEYITKTFRIEYLTFISEFVKNIKFMKNLVFKTAPHNDQIPINDLLTGGNIIKFKKNYVKFGSLKYYK